MLTDNYFWRWQQYEIDAAFPLLNFFRYADLLEKFLRP